MKMQQTTRLVFVYSAVLVEVLYRTGWVGGYSYQTEPLFRSYPDPEAASASGRPSAAAEVYVVRCEEDSMEVVVKAPPNELGFFEESARPKLGVSRAEDHCAARPSASGDYVIRAPLTACGSSMTFTKSAVLFSNLLLLPLQSSIWDVKEAAIPVLCQYKSNHFIFGSSDGDEQVYVILEESTKVSSSISCRRYTVSSRELRPTWTPHISEQSAHFQLDFRLRLMTSDWSSERKFPVVFMGETVNMEASVDHYNPSLRLYAGSCVATLTPDVHSHPRYPFIDHRGCFVDSLLSGSTSCFLPRVQDQLLHIQLQPFLFHEDHRHNIYITCYLKAAVVSEDEPENRACSFISGRWRSVDGDDHTCEICNSPEEAAEYGHKRAQRSQRAHTGAAVTSDQVKPAVCGMYE